MFRKIHEIEISVQFFQTKNEKHEKTIYERNKEVKMLKEKFEIQEKEKERLLLVNTMHNVNMVLNANKTKYLSKDIENSHDSKPSDKVTFALDEKGKKSEEMESFRNDIMTKIDVVMYKIRELEYNLN